MNYRSSTQLILVGLLLCAVACQAKFGFDIATQVDDFSCFVESSYEWVVIRAYRSLGQVDTNAVGNLQRARAQGLSTDVYMFPCSNVTKLTAEQQVDAMLAELDAPAASNLSNFIRRGDSADDTVITRRALNNEAPLYSRVWIDIETNPSNSCSWNNIATPEERCAFVGQIVARLQEKGKLVGIYASHYMWNEIFGNASACTDFADLPLWYARYNNALNFDDYTGNMVFGGWKQPYAKQYAGSVTVCDIGVDLNYY